ncbi:MAG: aldolase [Alphaproteobacteria bacterium]|nr:MAG: aldolase [Alphaproteobacteria bacterium]
MAQRVGVAEMVGVLGMVPTPSTPDADQWSCTQSVALDETAAMVERIVTGGVRILLTNGSLGEGATLTAEEHRLFTACIADTLRGRGLVFAGATTLNTRDTITRGRAALDAGADGLFLGRPMWMALDGQAIVRFYRDIADALPGVPIIVYDNQFAFKGKIDTATYAALAAIPEVIATKHIGGPSIAADLTAVAGRLRVLPLDTQWPALAEQFPAEALGCWSGNVADGTEPLIQLAGLVQAQDWPAARALAERMLWAQAPMFPDGRLEVFVEYNIPIAHARLAGSGLVRSGPPRPPYTVCPPAYWEGGLETGRRWAALAAAVRDGQT